MKARGLVALLVATLGAVCSCASAPTKGADAPEEASAESAAKEPVSAQAETNVSGYETEVDECADRACAGNTECCNGYSCGFDPERSRVQRYCLPG
jgi:hypothetical protein